MDQWSWDVRFQRGFNDWEMELVGAFFHTLSDSVLQLRMRWCLGLKGSLLYSPFYGVLRGSSSMIFPWKSIWGVKAPRRVSFLFG